MIDTLDLVNNRTDKNVAILKSALSNIPIVGNLLAEIMGSLIPNQQMDRVIRCITELVEISKRNETEIRDINKFFDKIKEKPINTLLFEQMVRYASQTESMIEHHCYAYYVFNAINDPRMEDVGKASVLRLISEFNEVEIILLLYLGNKDNSEFYEKYKNFIDRRSNYDSDEDKNFNAMQDAYLNNILVKGLSTAVDDPNKGVSSFHLLPFGQIVCEALFDEKYFI